MRIGIVYSGTYFGEEGPNAAQRRIRDFARGLAFAGDKVQVIVPKYNNPHSTCPDEEYGLKILGSGGNYKANLSSKYTFWKEAWRFIKDQIDAIFFYNTRVDGAFLAYAAKRSGKLVIAEFCDLRIHWNVNSIKNIPAWFDEQLIPKLTTHNIVISETIEKAIAKAAPQTPILQVPIIIDNTLFSYSPDRISFFKEKFNIPETATVIAYSGTFYKKYGVRYLLEAFAQLREKRKDLKLVLAGREHYTENHDNIPEIIKGLNLENDVIHTGWLHTEELISVISMSDIMVLPHTDDPLCVAGFPTKLGEYAAIGKPIVCTDVGDIKKYFHHGESLLFCQANSAKELEDAIIELLENPALQKRLGEGAREVAVNELNYRTAGKMISEFIQGKRVENPVSSF